LREQIKNPNFRRELARRSLFWFAHIYLGRHLGLPTPDFHREIYAELEVPRAAPTLIEGFRESAKSFIGTLALPLWSLTPKRKKFVIIAGETGAQSKLNISNLRAELETNDLLISDFGPFKDAKVEAEWTSTSLVLAGGPRVLSRSIGQKIRGMKHREARPDLVIADDIESAESVRHKEQRDKTEEWLFSEVLPAVDAVSGRVVVLGNLLHGDSVISRLERRLGEIDGKVLKYPLMNDAGECLWPEKFPPKIIEEKKAFLRRYFEREYMLRLVPDEGQVVKKISTYDILPKITELVIGIDLAISKKQTADFTAMEAVARGEDGKFYEVARRRGRWDFNEMLKETESFYTALALRFPGIALSFAVEDVAFQRAAIEEIRRRFGFPVEPIKQGTDKRARLETIAPYFEAGQALFPRDSDGETENELLNFGTEAHDDLIDALEMALRVLIGRTNPHIVWI